MPVGNLRSTEPLRRLRRAYFVSHGLFMFLGFGLIGISLVTEGVDSESLKDLDDFDAGGESEIVFYVTGGK